MSSHMTEVVHPELTDVTNYHNHVDDGFRRLMHDLTPYIDELNCVPHFFPFMRLPTELRNMIYAQYFTANVASVACHEWPSIRFTNSYVTRIRTRRVTAPFLPNLCLTSKALQGETVSCLLEVAEFQFDDSVAVGSILVLLKQSALRLTSKVRKMALHNPNGIRSRILYEYTDRELEKEARQLAEASNKLQMFSLPFFPRLRELDLSFFAPLLYTGPRWDRLRKDPIQALSIAEYMVGFRADVIVRFAELHRVTITGFSGYQDRHSRIVRNGNQIIDDKVDHLQAILHLCQAIKSGFNARLQDVVVEARLLYGQDLCQMEVFK